ncbi:MAG: hypothetical protein AB1477_06400 [Acidobacteriota bacterium]
MAFNNLDKKLAMGRVPQTDYVTPTAAAANAFVEQIAREPDGSFWTIEPKKMNNKGQGTGNRWATESWVEAWDSSLQFGFDASSQNLGRHLLAAFGSVASTTQGAGFKHVFRPLDTKISMQLPAYSFLELLAEGSGGISSLFPSGVCEKLELAGDGQGRVAATVNYRGSGKEQAATGYAWATHVQKIQGTQNYFFNTQADISIGGYPGNTSPVEFNCDLESWRFAYSNTLAADAGYRPGCPEFVIAGNPEIGVVRTECLLSDSAIEAEWTFRLRANDPALGQLKNQTPLEAAITLTGAVIGAGPEVHKLTITLHYFKYATHVRGVKDGIATVTITPDVIYSVADSEICEVELVNNVTSYTA